MSDGTTQPAIHPQNWNDLEREAVRPGVSRAGFRGDDVMLVMNWLQPGMETRPHSHPCEQLVYVVKGRIVVHTEFYDPVTLGEGESIYIDSNMGHAYVTAEGCDEAIVLGVCSSAEDGLMDSLLNLHGEDAELENVPA